MPNITFIDQDDNKHIIEADNGFSIMEVARDNDLGISGSCGGSISCCTCHVIIDPDWYHIVGKPNADEEDILETASGLQTTSRLGCQIEISDELEGLIVTIPE